MATRHQGDTAVKDKTDVKPQRPNMYKIIIKNDDFTPMLFVQHLLAEEFNLLADAARARMLEIHEKGQAVFLPFTHDAAETKVTSIMDKARRAGHPLLAVFEKT